ncbi:MAG TPA: M20/M25/M40 family metallo-hydrolase [Armatimonadota bacterium]|jgi:tripeptide aminopeptidase
MRDLLIKTFTRLVTTPSPTGHESAVAAVVREYLTDLGLAVSSDDAHLHSPAECGNLYAFLPATAPGYPVMMLNAHLDTVTHAGPIVPVLEGDVIRSEGDTILGADDKAGIALILLALRTLLEDASPHGDLWIVFTVAEETGLWGARLLDYDRLSPWPQLALVLDGGRQPGKMTIAAPSAVSLDVTFTGCAAHAGVCPEQGVSAIQAAAEAIAGMRLGRLDAETTANVGMIEGGSARNVVPEVCRLQAEARSHNEEKLAAQVAHLREQLESAAAHYNARVEVDVDQSYQAFHLAPDSLPVVRAGAAAAQLGIEPVREIGGGGSDANVFNERGIPALMFATGAAEVHTPQETLNVPAALRCLEWLLATITRAD